MIKIAITDIASTKISMTTIPINILDAADGFLANALMTEWPNTAITTDGPITATNIMPKIINVSANIILRQSLNHCFGQYPPFFVLQLK